MAIQVCYTLHTENLEREVEGLTEAMNTFKLKEGLIITLDGEDTFGKIRVIPAWKWMKSPIVF